MGLRVNTNMHSLLVQRNMRLAQREQEDVLTRISTGLRINSASDDPGGSARASILSGRLAAIDVATDSASAASNTTAAADTALQAISDILYDIRESVEFARSTGTATAEEIAEEQDAVDIAIAAIDELVGATSFNSRKLFNGESGYVITGVNGNVSDVAVTRAPFTQPYAMHSATSFELEITTRASMANFTVADAAAGLSNDIKVQIVGELGAETIVLQTGDTIGEIASNINAYTGTTGLYASNVGAALYMMSLNYGAGQSARMTQISGASIAAFTGSDTGVDTAGSLGGFAVGSDGLDISVTQGPVAASFRIASGQAAATISAFTVENTGMNFAIGADPGGGSIFSLGLPMISSDVLGSVERTRIDSSSYGGRLSTLATGGANALATDADNARVIVNEALRDVTRMRQTVGAAETQIFENVQDILGEAELGITSILSNITDADFAAETARYTAVQIILQAGVSALVSANIAPESVLDLTSSML